MLQNGTFPIDLAGINRAGFDAVGTPLNKATLLTDATAEELGLEKAPEPTVDSALQALHHVASDTDFYASDFWLYMNGKHPVLNSEPNDWWYERNRELISYLLSKMGGGGTFNPKGGNSSVSIKIDPPHTTNFFFFQGTWSADDTAPAFGFAVRGNTHGNGFYTVRITATDLRRMRFEIDKWDENGIIISQLAALGNNDFSYFLI